MANLSYVPSLNCSFVPNTLQGTTGYHLAPSHVDSVSGDRIHGDVADKLHGQTAAGARLVWECLIDTVVEALAEHQRRVSVCGVSFGLEIPGSTTAINGEPSEGAYVAITPSAAIRNAAAGISLVYSSGEGDVPKMTSVENCADHNRNEVVGTDPFLIVGSNLTTAGDDETITVVAANGTEAIAEVISEDGYGMGITARLATALPPGKGKVVLKTHGKRTPEGELRTLVKSVTILAGEPTPPPEPIAETRDGLVKVMSVADDETGDTFTYGDTWRARGEGFTGTEPGWAVNMAFI